MDEIRPCPHCGLIVEGWSATDGFHPYSHDCEIAEPAFLDNAMNQTIADNVAAERREIINRIEDHLKQVQQGMVPQSLFKQYEHYGRQQGIREVLSLIQQRGPIKQSTNRKEVDDE